MKTTLSPERQEALAAACKGLQKESRRWWFFKEAEGNATVIARTIEQLRREYRKATHQDHKDELVRNGKRMQNLYFAATGTRYP